MLALGGALTCPDSLPVPPPRRGLGQTLSQSAATGRPGYWAGPGQVGDMKNIYIHALKFVVQIDNFSKISTAKLGIWCIHKLTQQPT